MAKCKAGKNYTADFVSLEETYLALFHGARRVPADCDGEAPRREREPLASRPEPAVLEAWLQRWTNMRHREAAERTHAHGDCGWSLASCTGRCPVRS